MALATVAVLAGCSDDSDSSTDGGTDADTDTDTDTDSDTDSDTDGDTIVEGYVFLQGKTDHSGAIVALDGTDKDAVTVSDGHYQIGDVSPASYTITASLAGYSTETSNPFAVTPGQTTTVESLTLLEGMGNLSGTVLLDGETDHAGIVVILEGTSHVAVTDPTGSWAIDDVEEGNYAVKASFDGYEDGLESDQEVVAGQNTDVPTITLYETLSSISGTVTLSNTPDASGVSVTATATWNPSITHSGSTNSSGSYTIADVEPGMWDVEASKADYITGLEENVFVQADSPTVGVDFTLVYQPAGVAADLVYVSGGSNNSDPDQTGTVYNLLANPFVVEVQDAYGDPVPGTQVYFQIISPQTDGHMNNPSSFILTDSFGRVSDTYILGKVVGQNNVRAGATSVPGVFIDFYADGEPDVPDEIVALGGSSQSGVVGNTLASSIVVGVQDQWDNAVPGETVSFTPSGSGSALPVSAVTSITGQAQTDWTLGTTAGPQTLDVACGTATYQFTATADHDAAYEIVIAGGNSQTGINTTTLANPLVAEVLDQYGNPVDGETVTFAVTSGGGTLNPSTPQTTDVGGQAQVFLTLGSIGVIEVTASVSGLTPALFNATGITGAPNHLVLISGGSQNATVDTQLSDPIVVQLEDSYNNPVENATLVFTPGAAGGATGSAIPGTDLTGSNGQAQTDFTLGTLAGDNAQWVAVTVDSFPAVPALDVYADADPDEPTSIVIVSGDGQMASYGQTLSNPLVAHLEDQFGNPVWDYAVNWSSTTGGAVTPNPSVTDASGNTSVTATLGSTPGMPAQDFTSTANGHSVTFDATATGHWISLIDPFKVWPGYPDPYVGDPSLIDVEVTIHGGGFEAGANVIWDVGGADESIAPDSVIATEVVVQISADHLTTLGTFPITVENPGPDPCAPFDFEVDYMIPDTGQTQCYDAINTEVLCSTIAPGDPMYGQDGHYLQSTYGQHFYTDNGDGTVNDDVTGLMWQQCAAGLSGPGCATGSVATYNWYEATGTADATHNPGGAVDYCGDLVWGGHNDWVLPTVNELAGIVDAGQYNPAIDTTAFPGTPSNYFWSSSSYAGGLGNAWYVTFNSGSVSGHGKSNTSYARCVRGGSLAPGSFDPLILSGDRVVRDTDTGLTWQGCSAGQSGDDCVTGSASMMNWQAALLYCEDLDWGGCDDWHLPDRNELQSIVDYDSYGPSIDTTAFPGTPSDYFWSSSSCAVSYAWYVDFYNGSVYGFGKSNTYCARCVRGGP